MVTNNPIRGAPSASAERETKGQREQLGKGTKKPNGSAASLPGDSQAAPVIYEAGGGVTPHCSAAKIATQVWGTLLLPNARLLGWWVCLTEP